MHIEITSRHFKASENLRSFTQQELIKLKRYFDGLLTCKVVLAHDNGQDVAEIVIHSKGHYFTATEETDQMEKSIALAVDKLETQLKRFKDRLVTQR